MIPKDRSRCPRCGERVSPFAAGCAVCGADLDTTRFDRGPGLGNRLGSLWGAISFGPRGGRFAVIGLCVIALAYFAAGHL
jgi:hypothetical protein